MQPGEAIVMIILFLSFFALVFGIVYLQKRENLAMLERAEKNTSPWLRADQIKTKTPPWRTAEQCCMLM